MRMGGFPFACANLDDYGGRTCAAINIQAAAISPYRWGMWTTEGEAYGSIYNFTDSSEQPQATGANQFGGNESIYFNLTIRTT